jgi:hypothetical protein
MVHRSFEEIWLDIQQLKVVYTLDRRHENQVIFDPNKGMLRLSGAGKGEWTPVDKSAFNRAWERLVKDGSLEASRKWKVVCACLAQLPEVEYSLNPEKLWLIKDGSKWHPFGQERKV